MNQSLTKPIGITEVFLRNAIDESISIWWDERGHSPSWTDKSAEGQEPILDALVHRDGWRKRAKGNVKGRGVSHDDIIAHTSFSTWRNLIGNPSALAVHEPDDRERRDSWRAAKRRDEQCALLWKTVLCTAFPNIPKKKERKGQSPRGYVGSRILHVSYLRNRACHWDSLLNIDALKSYQEMLDLIACIDLQAAGWLEEQCGSGVRSVVARRPQWL